MKHAKRLVDFFGFNERTKGVDCPGQKLEEMNEDKIVGVFEVMFGNGTND